MSAEVFKLNDWLNVATIAGLFVGGSMFSGFRVGPLRAMSLMLRSRWIKNGTHKSLRHKEIEVLRDAVAGCTNKAHYVVVGGPKGVGKSCMIDTCFSKSMGVLRCSIAPDTPEKSVLLECYYAINGGGSLFIDPEPNVRRVLFWYRVLTFGNYPTMIIAVSERPPRKEPAELTGAVRRLAAQGLKVVVDASPNSLPPDLLSTRRQDIIVVEGMSDDNILLLPQLQVLHKQLDEAKLSAVVLKLLGGNPAEWERLAKAVQMPSEVSVHEKVRTFLCGMISNVVDECCTMAALEPKFKEVFTLLRDHESVDKAVLEEMQLVFPSRCKVLRMREVIGKEVQVQPIDPITAFVLQHGRSVVASEAALDALMPKPV